MKSVSSSLTSTSNAIEHRCDVLIIGSGAAGLSLALKLADHCQVIVLSKSDRNEGSPRYAQGGIAAVFDEQDSIDAHVKDTLAAGAGPPSSEGWGNTPNIEIHTVMASNYLPRSFFYILGPASGGFPRR